MSASSDDESYFTLVGKFAIRVIFPAITNDDDFSITEHLLVSWCSTCINILNGINFTLHLDFEGELIIGRTCCICLREADIAEGTVLSPDS